VRKKCKLQTPANDSLSFEPITLEQLPQEPCILDEPSKKTKNNEKLVLRHKMQMQTQQHTPQQP